MEVQIKDNKIYAPLKDKWLVVKPEEEVRQRYICRLVDSYGYDLKQMDQELKVTNSQRGQGAARADIVIWKYCCPLKLKMVKTSYPKPCKIGLRAYSFKK